MKCSAGNWHCTDVPRSTAKAARTNARPTHRTPHPEHKWDYGAACDRQLIVDRFCFYYSLPPLSLSLSLCPPSPPDIAAFLFSTNYGRCAKHQHSCFAREPWGSGFGPWRGRKIRRWRTWSRAEPWPWRSQCPDAFAWGNPLSPRSARIPFQP